MTPSSIVCVWISTLPAAGDDAANERICILGGDLDIGSADGGAGRRRTGPRMGHGDTACFVLVRKTEAGD